MSQQGLTSLEVAAAALFAAGKRPPPVTPQGPRRTTSCTTCHRRKVSCSLELPVCAACKKHAITLGQDPATVLCDYPVGPEELAEIAHRRASWDERFAHARGMTTATVSGEDQYDSLIGGWHDSPKRRTRSSVTAIESALEESKAGPGGSYLGPNASSSPSKSINKPAIKRHDSDSSSLSSASDDSAVDLTFGSRMKKVTKKVVRKQSVQRVAKNVKSAAVTKRDAGVGSTVATKEVGVQTENRLALPALAAVAAVNSATEILNRPQYHTRQPMPGVQHHHQQLPQQPEQQCQPEASYARYQQQSPYAQQRSQSHQHCIEHGTSQASLALPQYPSFPATLQASTTAPIPMRASVTTPLQPHSHSRAQSFPGLSSTALAARYIPAMPITPFASGSGSQPIHAMASSSDAPSSFTSLFSGHTLSDQHNIAAQTPQQSVAPFVSQHPGLALPMPTYAQAISSLYESDSDLENSLSGVDTHRMLVDSPTDLSASPFSSAPADSSSLSSGDGQVDARSPGPFAEYASLLLNSQTNLNMMK